MVERVDHAHVEAPPGVDAGVGLHGAEGAVRLAGGGAAGDVRPAALRRSMFQ